MSLYHKYRPDSFEGVFGNAETVSALQAVPETEPKERPHAFLIVGPHGCVDSETEFLSPSGWKTISSWDGEKVLQFSTETNTASFVKPTNFIKRKSQSLYHFKTKYGLNQCLSLDHRVLYYDRKRGNPLVSTFGEIKRRHEKSKSGFGGRFARTFNVDIDSSLNVTDEELRVQVMVIADSHIPENSKNCCLNLKKPRKIKRAEYLLLQAGISYRRNEMTNGYTRFYFVPPFRHKEFTSDYYKCSSHQLNIISDEVFHWDGSGRRYSTTSKLSKDFIQYALAASGMASSVRVDKRKGRTTTYDVLSTPITFSGMSKNVRINQIEPKDGYEYCFTVPSGFLVLRRNNRIFITGNCGKTSIGRILAKELGCGERDYNEIDSADFRGIDTFREIRQNSQFAPVSGECRVYLCDEIHMATKEGQNAFLKALEDTPSHVYYILCTTNPEKLLPTVKSRCSTYHVEPLGEKEMKKLLHHVVKQENEHVTKKVYDEIIEKSCGVPRDALQMLDQVLAVAENERENMAFHYEEQERKLSELSKALLNNHGWKKVANILKDLQDEDPEGIRHYLLAACKNELLKGQNNTAAAVMEEMEDNLYSSGFPGLVFKCYSIVEGT